MFIRGIRITSCRQGELEVFEGARAYTVHIPLQLSLKQAAIKI